MIPAVTVFSKPSGCHRDRQRADRRQLAFEGRRREPSAIEVEHGDVVQLGLRPHPCRKALPVGEHDRHPARIARDMGVRDHEAVLPVDDAAPLPARRHDRDDARLDLLDDRRD
jgi:hypothetical protein